MNYACAASALCRNASVPYRADYECLECQQPVHVGCELECSIQFHNQQPTDDQPLIAQKNLSKEGKRRLVQPRPDSSVVRMCLQCTDKIYKKLPKKRAPAAPRKAAQATQPKAPVLRELRGTAAFYAQTFVYQEYETRGNVAKFSAQEDQFFGKKFPGDPTKDIVGALKQLIDGTGPFQLLYDVQRTDQGVDRTLKELIVSTDSGRCYGYVAGIHFTVGLLSRSTYSSAASRLDGRLLWKSADAVMCNLKKAMTLMPKLKGKLVILAADGSIEDYVSGHNERQFFQFILDGMYAMDLDQKKVRESNKETAVSTASATESVAVSANTIPLVLAGFTDAAIVGAAPSATASPAASTEDAVAELQRGPSRTPDAASENPAADSNLVAPRLDDPDNLFGSPNDEDEEQVQDKEQDDEEGEEQDREQDGEPTEQDREQDGEPTSYYDDVDDETVGRSVTGGGKGYLTSKDLDWDPWDGVHAPKDWRFIGFSAFACFGPTSPFFSVLIKSGGYAEMKDKKKGGASDTSRAALRRKERERATLDRDAGGSERGMSMDTKVNFAALAQNEAEATSRDYERASIILNQEMAAHTRMFDFNMKLASYYKDKPEEHEYMKQAVEANSRVMELSKEMATMRGKKRIVDPLVASVLKQGADALGIKYAKKAAEEADDGEAGGNAVESAVGDSSERVID